MDFQEKISITGIQEAASDDPMIGFSFLFFFYIYLAVLGLRCSALSLRCGVWASLAAAHGLSSHSMLAQWLQCLGSLVAACRL